MPVQAAASRSGLSIAKHIPRWFHSYVARVLGLNVRLVGDAPSGSGVLFVANHVSWLDIITLSSVMPVSFIAKSEVSGWPLFGTLARLQGTIFVDRQRRHATATVAEMIGGRLAAGDTMVLFAEGTTSDGNRVLPFRSSLVGAVRTMAEEGRPAVPVQPLAIAYTHKNGLPITRREMPDIAWYADMELLPHLKALVGGGPIDAVVCLGTPMDLEHAADRKRVSAAAELWVRQVRRNGHAEAGAHP
jgi:1-acyl-sn-glycerol-3-phosphate acyltransferase